MKGDEIIREIEIVLALAILAIPVQCIGDGGVDILGKYGGVFETEESAFRFPGSTNVNFDSLTVGNDRAMAIGRGVDPIATNNLEIKKNQDSGDCECCNRAIDNASPCQDCCTKLNMETIKVGDREAMAFGLSSASNYVKIVTNQK